MRYVLLILVTLFAETSFARSKDDKQSQLEYYKMALEESRQKNIQLHRENTALLKQINEIRAFIIHNTSPIHLDSIRRSGVSSKRSQQEHVSDVSDASYDRVGSSRVIHTGPRGGRYYINDKGNKVYIKR